MKRKSSPKVQNLDELSCASKVKVLERLVKKLKEELPEDRSAFKEIYQNEIRRIVQNIEACPNLKSRPAFLQILDSDFNSVFVAFSPVRSSELEKFSVFRQEFSFFLGGLTLYIANARSSINKQRRLAA